MCPNCQKQYSVYAGLPIATLKVSKTRRKNKNVPKKRGKKNTKAQKKKKYYNTTKYMQDNRNAHGQVRRAISHRNLQENAGPGFRDARFVRVCAIETHPDISQELLCGNLQETCRIRIRPPRLNTEPFTVTVRTPTVWPHCSGEPKDQNIYPVGWGQ